MGRSTENLYKNALKQAFTTQPNIQLNTDTIMDAMKLQQDMKEEDKIENTEATSTASSGAYSAPLFTKEETKEDKLEGGKADNISLMDIALKHSKDKRSKVQSPERIDKMFLHLIRQLAKGIRVEREHTKDKRTAREIALDHLMEDPNYYSKLRAIEESTGEATEATTTASTGAYSTPAFIAKGDKNWRGGKKPLYKGGKFVKIKKKCLTFPYCNQGAGAIDLSEKVNSEQIIQNVSNRLGLTEEAVLNILSKINNNIKKR